MLFPRTRSILLFVFATIAGAALVSYLLVSFVDVQPMSVVRPKRMPGGVWVTYFPDHGYEMIQKQLHQKVELPDGIADGTPLQNALGQLAESYGLKFFLDTEEWKAAGIADVRMEPVRLPRLRGVSLSTTLRLLLGQIKGEAYSGVYRIGNRGIVITTTAVPCPRRPGRVVVTCIHEPLNSVLHELARQTERSIVMADGRTATSFPDGNFQTPDSAFLDERFKQPVSAELKDVDVATAVRVLAEMAGLAVAEVDGVDCIVATKATVRQLVDGTSIWPAQAVSCPRRQLLEPLANP